MEHLATGLSIIPGAFSEAESTYSQFPFDENMRLYEHDMRGNYCRLRGVHAQAEFEIEYLKPDPWTVLLRMTETKPPASGASAIICWSPSGSRREPVRCGSPLRATSAER